MLLDFPSGYNLRSLLRVDRKSGTSLLLLISLVPVAPWELSNQENIHRNIQKISSYHTLIIYTLYMIYVLYSKGKEVSLSQQ